MKVAQALLYPWQSGSVRIWLCLTVIGLGGVAHPAFTADSAFGYGDAIIENTPDQAPSATRMRIESFRGLDKNRDGVLSRAEMQKSTRYTAWRVIDRNHDGRISSREYSDYRAHRERSANPNSVGATETADYGDPYLNTRLGKSTTTLKKGSSETGPVSESHYEEVLRKSNLARESRKTPVGY